MLTIFGNDDPRINEEALLEGASAGLLSYIHMRKECLGGRPVYGYAMTPPSPFRLKDWERYDVGRYVDPGSVSPEEGVRSVPADRRDIRYGTIAGDLRTLAGDDDLSDAVLLLHAPPYRTGLDRAAAGRQERRPRTARRSHREHCHPPTSSRNASPC